MSKDIRIDSDISNINISDIITDIAIDRYEAGVITEAEYSVLMVAAKRLEEKV